MKTNKYLVFSAIGFELVGLIVGAVLLGSYLDKKLNLNGIAIVALSITALIGWIMQIVRLANKIEQEAAKNLKAKE